MKRISSKIMLIIIGCSVFTACLVGGFSLILGAAHIKDEANSKLTYMSRSYANEFSQTLKKTESYMDSLHSTIIATFDIQAFNNDPAYISNYQKELDIIMQSFALKNTEALGIYVTFNPNLTDSIYEVWYLDIMGNGVLYRMSTELLHEYGTGLNQTYLDPSIFYPEQESLEYLYETLEKKEPSWFGPCPELGLDVTPISYVMPIIIDDVIIGVVGMDIDFEEIKKTIEGMDVYYNGYAFLMDDNFNVMVHPSYEETVHLNNIENGRFSFLIHHMVYKPHDSINYIFKNQKEILGYCKLSNGWILALVPPVNEIFKPIHYLSIFIIFLTLLGICMSIFIAYLFSSKVSKTMDTATRQLRYIEVGDFTQEIPKDLLDRDDDLGHFIKSVYTMQNVIKDLMKEFETQEQYESHISSLFINNAAQITQDATSKAALAIEQIATERIEKDENLKETLEKLENLNTKLQVMVNEEVQKNRQKDAVMIYQSRLAKMGQMIANIAHQWRQPLNSLNIILSELKDSFDYDELDHEHFENAINKSNQIIVKMSQTIDDFRNFLSPSNRQESFFLHETIKFTLDLMEENIRSNNINIETNAASNIMILGYSNEFSQVISNILNNAIDALLESNVSNKTIRISILQNKEVAEVRIFNNGNPISPEIMDKIFTPYFTTKKFGQGTGIGLYMSKIMIEEHMKGKIFFKNMNSGVCCYIQLPTNG